MAVGCDLRNDDQKLLCHIAGTRQVFTDSYSKVERAPAGGALHRSDGCGPVVLLWPEQSAARPAERSFGAADHVGGGCSLVEEDGRVGSR